MNRKKYLKKIISLIMAVIFIIVDIPISGILKVNAENEQVLIKSITYSNNDNMGEFEITADEADIEYINTQADSIDVVISLDSSVEKLNVDDIEQDIFTDSESNKYVQLSINYDTVYVIKALQSDESQYSTANIEWIRDDIVPTIDKIMNEKSEEYTMDSSLTNYISEIKELKVYITETNIKDISVNSEGITDILTDAEGKKYFEYTVSNTGTYDVCVKDLAGNECRESIKFEVDTVPPEINSVVNANNGETYIVNSNGNVNYVKNDMENVRIYVYDTSSGVKSLKINDETEISEIKTDASNNNYFETTVNAGSDYKFDVYDNVDKHCDYNYSFVKMTAPDINAAYGMDSAGSYVEVNGEINYTEDGRYRVYFDTAKGNSAEVKGIIYTTNDEYNFNTDRCSEVKNDDGYFYIDLDGIDSYVTYNFWAYDNNGNISGKKTITFCKDSSKIEIYSYEVEYMFKFLSKKNYKLTMKLTAGVSGFTVNSVKDKDNNDISFTISNDEITIVNLTKEQLKQGINVYASKNMMGSNEQKCTFIYDDIISMSNTSDVIIGANDKKQELKFNISSSSNVSSVEYEVFNQADNTTTGIKGELSNEGNNTYIIPIENLIRSKQDFEDGNYIVVINAKAGRKNWLQTINVIVDTTRPEFTMTYSDDKKWISNDSANDITITDIADNLTKIDIDDCYFAILNENGEVDRVSTGKYWDCFEYDYDMSHVTLKLSKYLKKANLEDNKYKIYFYTKDEAENFSSKNVDMYLSNAVTDFKTTVTNEWVNPDRTETEIVISDIYTGISGISNITVLIDNVDYSDKLIENNGKYSLNVSELYRNSQIVDGVHSIVTEVRNGAYESDNSNTKNYKILNNTLKVDTKKPNISNIQTRYAGEWISEGISAIIDSDDTNEDEEIHTSGVNKIIVYSQKQSEDNIDAQYVLQHGKEYKGVIDAPDVTNADDEALINMSGNYECFFVATDNAGNISDVFEYNEANFDVSIPQIKITKLAEPDYSNDGVLWYKDKITFKYKITTLYARINTNSITAQIETDNEVIKGTDVLEDDGKRLTGEMSVNMSGNWKVKISAESTTGIKNSMEDIIFAMDKDNPYFDDSDNPQKIDANSYIDGTYYDNSKIEISGEVSDKQDKPYSGIKQVELLDEKGAVVAVSSNSETYTFTLIEKKTYSDYTIRIIDNVGNDKVSEKLPDMVISQDISDIKITPESNYITVDKKQWYSKNSKLDIDVNNAKSGIADVQIMINNTIVSEDKNVSEKSKITSKQYSVKTTDKIINSENCSYVVKVTVKDNAGNYSNSTYTIYKDTEVPQIKNFAFNDLNNGDVINTAYGYFFNKEAKVTISVVDGAVESGVKSISFYMVSKDGGKTNVITKTASNGKAMFTVPAGFKGQIYAYAEDNAGNECNATRVAGSIIETNDMHEKYSSIIFSKPDTSYKDANNLDLYNSNINVVINIKDSFSGIASASWEVVSSDANASNVNGSIRISNNGAISGSTDNITNKVNDENIVTSLTKNILVDANSNNITIKVTMVDNSGNTSTKYLQFSIDKTAPEITVSYDNNSSDSSNTEMFNNNRVATITVKERNFNANDVIVNITSTETSIPTISEWTRTDSSGNGDNTVNTASIVYSNDGDYNFNISYKDMSENVAAVDYGNSVSPNKFTIDKIKPIINIDFDNNNVSNGNYYQNARTATIRINEHNFSVDRVAVSITENGSKSSKTVGNWDTSGDLHTASVVFNSETEYNINLSYLDMAGNAAENTVNETFVIDTQAPKLTIDGITDRTPYNNDKIGFTVNSNDTYFNSLETTLYQITSSGDKKVVALDEKQIDNGKTYSISNVTEDGIYKLYCVAKDKSNKMTEQSILFSVNRNGSTYFLGEYADVINKKIVKSVEDDITITEVNVNDIDLKKLSVILYYGTNTLKLEQGVDYTVSENGGDEEWSTYIYKFNKNIFAKEGEYTISITSNDDAGNVTSNEDEGKKAGLMFSVDETAPICSVYNLEKGKTYGVSSKEVRFNVIDNISLASVTVFLNGKELYTLTGDKITEDNMKFTIDESTNAQSVKITYVDAAGNSGTTEVKNFYVTTNVVVKYVNNNGLLIGSIVAASVIILVIVILVYKSKKKKNK